MQSWQPTAVVLSFLTICAGVACTAEPPDECLAFVSCFAQDDTDGGQSAYLQVESSRRETGAVGADDAGNELSRAYGAGGNCWLTSPENRVWLNCHLVCAKAIESHCALPNVEGDEQTCRESPGTEPTYFRGPNPIRCEEISGTVERLQGQLDALDEAESQSQ